MIKNYKSNDLADNLGKGYGIEVREIGNFCSYSSSFNASISFRSKRNAFFRLWKIVLLQTPNNLPISVSL